MKLLKNKDIKPIEEIEIPELEIHGIWKKIFNWISHIRHIYWLIFFAVFLAVVSILMPNYIWKDLWSGIKSNKALVIMLMVFCLVSVSLLWSIGQRIDVWVFRFLNMRGRRTPFLDWIMLCLTQLGNFIFAMVVASVLFIKGNHLLAYEIILGTLTLGLVIGIIKVLIHRIRPYIRLKNIRIVGSRASGRSFPSGHTGQSFFMASLLVHFYHVNIYVWLVLYAIALLVGVTRIYVGMHYPRDVLAGAILGTAWGLVGIIINSYLF